MVQIGVIGTGQSSEETDRLAFEVGRAIARAGALLCCGGLGGVMAAAARGARSEKGLTLGLLPGPDRNAANPHIDVVVPTDMGHARNALVVRTADALIAVGGGYGTLSEIALGLKMGKPVVGLQTWQIKGVHEVTTPADAVRAALARV